jgi:hypothetical protein
MSNGLLLNIGTARGRRQLILDGVTLVGRPDNDNPLVGIYENGHFILKSGAITGNTHNSTGGAYGGGVEVSRGIFTMEGGTISRNTVSGVPENDSDYAGGGVAVVDGGSFTMSGGTIADNRVSRPANGYYGDGGGVYVRKESVFIMSGGAISGNIITSGGIMGSFGGGVRVYDGTSTFIMTGGTISGNSVSSKAGEGGGGVSSRGVFIMEGGTIYGKAGSLPAGTDAGLANSARNGASLDVSGSTTRWGTGGVYTKGGEHQTGGSHILHHENNRDRYYTDDTLIAIPAP